MGTEIKTTIYDIFGYLVPGLLAMLLGLLAYHHSIHTPEILCGARRFLSALDLYSVLVLFLAAYPLGYLISGFSSILVEGLVLKKAEFLSRYRDDKLILAEDLYESYRGKVRRVFGTGVDSRTFGLCVCFAEAKQPSVYSTAFVFLAFYGMARNLTLVFFLYSIWELANWALGKDGDLFLFVITSVIATFGFFFQYLRFYRYFRQHILNAFLLPNGVKT